MPLSHPTTVPVRFLAPVRFLVRYEGPVGILRVVTTGYVPRMD